MSTADADTTPIASSSRALPPVLPPPVLVTSSKSSEYIPTRHVPSSRSNNVHGPGPRPDSTTPEIITAAESPIQTKQSRDTARLSVGSARGRDIPRQLEYQHGEVPEDRTGIGAYGSGHDPTRRLSIRSPQLSLFDDGGRYAAVAAAAQPPPMADTEHGPRRHSTMDTFAYAQSVAGRERSRSRPGTMVGLDGSGDGSGGRRGSGVGWIVPVDFEKGKPTRRLTVRERIQPTLELAQTERDKYAARAKMTGYALNAAIGAQVVFGALTTGLSAALSGRQVSVATAVLGGFSTIFASYLARARGSNEPELSICRTKDLEQFIRECQAFQLDYGHLFGVDHTHDPESEAAKNLDEGTPMEKYLDVRLEGFRIRFEEMLGNASGERKLAEPLGSLVVNSKPPLPLETRPLSTGFKSQA